MGSVQNGSVKKKNGKISDLSRFLCRTENGRRRNFMRKKSRMKRWVVAVLLLSLTAGCLTGCKKKNQGSEEIQKTSKEYVYQMQAVDFTGVDGNPANLLALGDKLYAYEYQWQSQEGMQPRSEMTETAEEAVAEETEQAAEEETQEAGDELQPEEDAQQEETAAEDTAASSEVWTEEAGEQAVEYQNLCLYEIKEDGTVGETHMIEGTPNETLYGFVSDADGNLYCIRNVYGYDEATDSSRDEYYIERITIDGELLNSIALNELPEVQKLREEQGWFYTNTLVVDDTSVYAFTSSGTILSFDKECNFQSVAIANDGSGLLDGNVYMTKDHTCVVVSYGESDMKLTKLDLKTGTIGESFVLPGNSYDYSFYPGYGYDFYIADSYAVYGYNIGDTELTKLMSYVDSDLDVWQINNIVPVSETEFYGGYSGVGGDNNGIAKFTKVPPEEVKDKQVLTLALVGMDWEIKSRIIAFNKANADYRISILDYYSDSGDYDAGISKLNTDIVSGKVPDIIVLNENMPVDSYINKGLFADLMPFIEKDEEIDEADLMPNVIEAFSKDGRLYQLVPGYTIRTLAAKTSEVGAERGWTLKEAMELWDSKPARTDFISGMTRAEMLQTCMMFAGDQFVDYGTGECDFANEDFELLLEFLSRFPVELPDDYYSDDFWNQYDSMWRRGVVLTQALYLNDFRSLTYTEQGTFGEPVTLIGIPSANEDGSAIVADTQFAISAKSKHQDAAWEFLRYYLLDEYQTKTSGFPISMKKLNERAKEATQKPYYTDENGNKVEYDDTTYVDGVEIKVQPMSQEEASAYVELLKSFTNVGRYDMTLINIITEEAEPYYNGQKSASEVAKIVQNRAKVYLHEIQ